jgi:hypothetical protein
MVLRGFDGAFRSLDEYALRRADAAYGALMLAATLALAAWNILQATP